jgi:hypothetical protein
MIKEFHCIAKYLIATFSIPDHFLYLSSPKIIFVVNNY